MKQIYHFRLLYAVVLVLTMCLLLVGGAYRLKAREIQSARADFSAVLGKQQLEILELRARIAAESKVRQDAFQRLLIYPNQAAAFRHRINVMLNLDTPQTPIGESPHKVSPTVECRE